MRKVAYNLHLDAQYTSKVAYAKVSPSWEKKITRKFIDNQVQWQRIEDKKDPLNMKGSSQMYETQQSTHRPDSMSQ